VCSIKKKLISLAVALVFIWLVVSAYFYGQHYIVMKDYPLYAKVDTGDAVIIISNVRVYGFERSGYFFDQQWYWSIADKIKNPNIQYPFLKICFFYTRPYIFDKDERTIQLQGLIAFKDLTYIKYIDLMIEELDRANSIITQFLSLPKTPRMKN